MFKFLFHSDIAVRINLNPMQWVYKPTFAYDGPTPIMPKRRTIAIVWLFLQLFIDIHDGTMDLTNLNMLFNPAEEVIDVSDDDDTKKVGSSVFGDGEPDRPVVKRSEL